MKSNNKILNIIIIAVIFGLAGGIVGSIVSRVYILDSIYDVPFFGEINFSNNNLNGSGLLIRSARNITIEQDTRIVEAVEESQGSIAGIFIMKPEQKQGSPININNFYNINEPVGLGLIITSDGWLVTNSLENSLSEQNIISTYVVMTDGGNIYYIDGAAFDPATKFTFIHIKDAKDLPVMSFSEENEVMPGQTVLALGWDSKNLITYISDKNNLSNGIVKISDEYNSEYELEPILSGELKDYIVIDLKGDVVGLVKTDNKVEPISHFSQIFSDLFKSKEIVRPLLGLNYTNFSDLNALDTQYKKGAIVSSDQRGVSVVWKSPASIAGIKMGDILISVDGVELNQNNDLSEIIMKHSPGDTIKIEYLRDGEKNELEIELGEKK